MAFLEYGLLYNINRMELEYLISLEHRLLLEMQIFSRLCIGWKAEYDVGHKIALLKSLGDVAMVYYNYDFIWKECLSHLCLFMCGLFLVS